MSETANYDRPWKEAITEYFEQFLSFFFPQVHELIDWSQPPQSLDKELQQITASSETGLALADKLFQVWQKNQQIAWILVHIEIQSQEKSEFAQRMYVYNYRAFDLYERPVISLAILGDERSSWRPNNYGYEMAGFCVSIKFPIVKLLDYDLQWESLSQSLNPFAIMVMAHLKTQATTGKPRERQQWKWTLVRSLYEKDYSRDNITKIFQLIDLMMGLPIELQNSFKQTLKTYEEETTMRFMSTMEEMAMEEGIERGALRTARESVITVLRVRLGEVPSTLQETINNLEDLPKLKQLLEIAITVNSLSEFERSLNS